MIKFFRRIRKRLLSENKFSKYLLYAIGEIFLVVIGILIALSINNWNENKKSLKKTDALLSQVHIELAFNIDKANRVINFYRNKDSLLFKVLNKELTYNDYKSNWKFVTLLRGSREVNIVSDAFTTLTDNQNEFIPDQEAIVKKLIHLYGTDKKEVDIMDEFTVNSLFDRIKKLEKDGWIYDNHVNHVTSDEQINYYLTSPDYFGEVTGYKIRNLIDHAGFTLTFRNHAMEVYNELSDYLSIKKDSAIIKNVNEYVHYIGSYETVNGNFTYEIKKQNNRLIWTWRHKIDSTRFGEIIFYPDTKTYFTLSDSRFGRLIYDENNEVESLILSRGDTKQVCVKMK